MEIITKFSLDSRSLYTKSVFLNAVIEFSKKEDIVGRSCQDVYEQFCEWCSARNLEPPSTKLFSRAIGEAYGIKSKPKRINGVSGRVWDYK